jgi:hypothetical protein
MLMTREQIEDRMMDYLYEELSEQERSAFEAAVSAYPDLQEAISEFRNTRSSFESLPQIEVPNLVKANILREARLAVAEAESTWFARLTAILTRPAMGTAFAAVLVASVGLLVIERGGVFQHEEETRVSPAEDISRTAVASAAEEQPEMDDNESEEEGIAKTDDLIGAILAEAEIPTDTGTPASPRLGAGSSSGAASNKDIGFAPPPQEKPATQTAPSRVRQKQKESRSKKQKRKGKASATAQSAPPPKASEQGYPSSGQDNYGSKNTYGLGSGGGAPRANGMAKTRARKEQKRPIKEMAPIAVQEKAAPPSTSYVGPAANVDEDDASADLLSSKAKQEEEKAEMASPNTDEEVPALQDNQISMSPGDALRTQALNNKSRASTRDYIKYLKTLPKEQTTQALVEAFELALKTGPLDSAKWILSKLEQKGFDPQRLAKMKAALEKKMSQKKAN